MSFIAIVDDRTTNRRIWTKLASGVEPSANVESFPDPSAALSRIMEETPDLIITDFQMPGMDGAEFIRRIRKLPNCEDVPVIVVSVYEDRSFRYEALEAGATDFLMSPVDHYEFRTRAKNLLTMRKQQLLLKERATSLEDELKSETARHAEAMRQSYSRMIGVLDTLPAAVYASDRDGNCQFMNRFGATAFGVDHEAVSGKPLLELFGPEKGAFEREGDDSVFAGSATFEPYEELVKLSDGSLRTFLTSKNPLENSDNQDQLVLTTALDITDRKSMEIDLRNAMEDSQQANRAKGEFLANMSHELRTPLNAIIGFSDVMANEHLGPIGNARYLEYAADIGMSGTHLLGIINNILDLAQAEEGSEQLWESEVNTSDLLADITRMMRGEAAKEGVAISASIPDSLPALRGDQQKIRQIVLNILANAIKYTESGGSVDVGVSLRPDSSLEITISDTGIGMDEEQIEVAKSRFGQVYEHHQTKAYQGAGLGLSIAIELAEMHGGSVDIKSKPEAGTKVSVAFPPSRTIRKVGQSRAG